MNVRLHSPPFSRRGGCASIRRSRSLAAQTGWLVISNKMRIATRAYKEATRPFTNHPVCAAKERDLLLMAQPPLLENGGEWTRLTTNPIPSTPRRNLWDSSEQFVQILPD